MGATAPPPTGPLTLLFLLLAPPSPPQFAGESHHINDDLQQLARAVAQEDLPADVAEDVRQQVDTAGLLAALIAQVEGAIRFLASTEPGDVESAMLLQDFVLAQLQVSAPQWEGASVEAVRRGVRLCHLEALNRQLQDQAMGKGSWTEQVGSHYKVPLPEAEAAALEAAAFVNAAGLREHLKYFMVDAKPPSGEDLGMWLSFRYDYDDLPDGSPHPEMADCDNFPRGLQMKHLFAAHEALGRR